MKRILIVYYSQSGQMERVARVIAEPLRADGHQLSVLNLEPARSYPFPWGFWQFLDAFPESVDLDPPPLKPWHVEGRFDLIIVCYTVWYLSPAPPVTAFLKSDEGRALLRDTPVVTVTACRNMWVMAQEEIKKLLAAAGARHCDHVALVDAAPALATFVTTPRWMLTGRKGSVLGLPAAGLTNAQVADSARFGRALASSLAGGTLDGRSPVLRGLGAARVDPALVVSERIGRRSFGVWGKLVRNVGPPGHFGRRPVLGIYLVFLALMIVTVVPISMLVRAALTPLLRRRMEAQAAHYEMPSGSGTERLHEFS